MPSAFQDLVFLLQEYVASVVQVFKVLQRHYDDPHKVRFEDRRRRQLNRRLTATMKRLSGVHVLNPEWQVQGKSGHDNSSTTICLIGSLSAATSFPESVQRAGLGG
ncbi:uncharacterized protein LOC144097427 [Amblyomma americanum]